MHFTDKLNKALILDKGVKLTARQVRELASAIHLQGERAISSEMMLQAFAMRVNGQASVATH